MYTNTEAINQVFGGSSNLRKRVFDAIRETPQHEPLFGDIARYFCPGNQFIILDGVQAEPAEPASKKRKIEGDDTAANDQFSDGKGTVIFAARDISFTLPQRKKLHLNIVQYGEDTNAATTMFTLCGRNPATSQVEFEYPMTAFSYILRVPVPEKAQKQYNFCMIPSQLQATPSSNIPKDGIIWTVNYGPLKSYNILSDDLSAATASSENVLENVLDVLLQRTGNKVVYPTDAEFVSSLVESHRKNDKAYHVKAFRGSKDGYLFLLENGIFFGFKKPLGFFPLHEIESVSYTAVLQRTFNLIIGFRGANDVDTQEIEFSMIDQADFAGIDTYIKKHQLQDASMAEARRAKIFKVNGAKGDVAEDAGHDGQTELQKAEQELEDEEDELEEDYDPGSEGDSEGSGMSSDDDDYEYPKSKSGPDLVKEELGSEAEEVTDSGDEEPEEQEEEEEDEEGEEEEEEEEEVPAPIQTKTVVKPTASSKPPPPRNGPDYDDEDQL